MHIWHVTSNEPTILLLYRTDKNVFRVIQDGEYAPILTNGTYSLVNKAFKDVFLLAKDQLTIQPVTIYDHQFNTINEDYVEISFLNSISPYTIDNEDSNGYKAWGHGGDIFVSQALKEQFAGNTLSFSPGFSLFG